MNDLIIIGGGPAGAAAAVYAARKRLKTVLIAKEFGGQSVVSEGIQNWIGTILISGAQLAQSLKTHVTAYAENYVTVMEGDIVSRVEKKDGSFVVTTEGGKTVEAKTVLVATGSIRRKLFVPGAELFEHKGITYCASCDGPLFSDQDVAVIGGGNAAFETAAQLLAYCKSVTLINRSNEFRADPITVEKVLSHEKMHVIKNTDLVSIEGTNFVSGITYKEKGSDETKTLPVTGIFAEIGQMPSTSFVEGIVDMTEYKQIIIDPRTQRTSVEGIWAAGDCTDVLYHQNNIAAGDAVRALEDIYLFIHAQ